MNFQQLYQLDKYIGNNNDKSNHWYHQNNITDTSIITVEAKIDRI